MHRKGPGSVASSRRGAKVEGKKHKLRVAFLHPDLGLGGAERLILDAVLELRARGHDVVLYTAHHDVTHCFSETLVDGARAPWLRVYGDWLPRSVRGRGHAACAILRCLFLALCLLATVSRRQHAIVVDQVSAPLLLLRFLCRSKLLFYCHFPDLLLAPTGGSALRAAYRAPLDALEERTTGLAHAVLVNSRFTASVFAGTFARLAARGVRPAVLYPAAALPDKAAVRPVPAVADGAALAAAGVAGVPAAARLMVSINRFERKKGLPLALRCLAEVQSREAKATAAAAAAATAAASAASSAPVVAAAPKSSLVKAAPAAQSPAKGGAARTAPPAAPAPPRPPLHLVLAGGYDPRLADSVAVLEELKAEAAVLGVAASVTFAPNVSDTAKAALLREATLLLYTPQGEHFGMVPLEAMAAGRPVVAADSGGPTESVLHATTGFLARPTPAAFADAAQRLLDNPTVARAAGLAARRHVEARFSRTAFGAQLETVLQGLVADKAGARV